MVQDYTRQPATLADAVTAAYQAIPMLLAFATNCQRYALARQLVGPGAASGAGV